MATIKSPGVNIIVHGLPADPALPTAVTGTFFQGTQPVSGTFWQATQPTKAAAPLLTDILGGSRTTTGTLITIPAGRVWKGSVSVAATNNSAGTWSAQVSTAGAGVVPAGSLLAVCASTIGIPLTAATYGMAQQVPDLYIAAPVGNAVTLEVSILAASNVYATANGLLL